LATHRLLETNRLTDFNSKWGERIVVSILLQAILIVGYILFFFNVISLTPVFVSNDHLMTTLHKKPVVAQGSDIDL